MADHILKLENLTKVFDNKIWALKKINLSIIRGESVAIIGPNGSGKSVLAKIISNLSEKTSGIVEYNFVKNNILHSIGYQFRDVDWPIGFVVKDVINLYKYSYGIDDEEWMDILIKTFNIEINLNKNLDGCSITWLKLFTLFLALIHKPELVILDEISNTIGIDVKNKIINFLYEYKENNNATFIFVSPDKMIFDKLCDKIVVLHNGLIIKNEYIKDMASDFEFEEFTTHIMKDIEKKTIKPKPDPVFKPILSRFEEFYKPYIESYENIKNKLIDFIDKGYNQIENIKVKLKNRNHYIKVFYEQLLDISNSFLSKLKISKARKILVKLINSHKLYIKGIKRTKITDELKKMFIHYNELNTQFIIFINKKLVPIFRDDIVFVKNDDKTISMSKHELNQLKAMKQKMIHDELKRVRIHK